MSSATIVHDPSEAVELCAAHGLYLKPITRVSISVALPPLLRQPGKSVSNWEVMERLRAMAPGHPFPALRIAKSTMDLVRFEGELEHRSLVGAFLARLDGRSIKLSGFPEALRVRAAEFRPDFPTRHDWDSFFRDAEDMNETLPGERPDTIHLEGLPCKWFTARESPDNNGGGGNSNGSGGGSGSAPEKPSEEVLARVFSAFGDIRHVDIPMLDPYREEMTGRSFHTFSFGGHLNFEAYVQYREYAGFARAMGALRGMKLMYKGDDGKAVACNIKVSFDSTKHLSDASIRKRQLERQKLQELERQREEQKRREKEAEELQRAEERRQKEQEQQERVRRQEEKLRRREQRQHARELRRGQRRLEKLQAEEERRLHERIRMEERKLLLAQRNLQSIRLVAELLARAEAARQAVLAHSEERQRRQRLELRRRQEAELRRVEEEKRRALGLQQRERELRGRLLGLLLSRRPDAPSVTASATAVLDILHCVSAGNAPGVAETQATILTPVAIASPELPGNKDKAAATARPMGVLSCIPDNMQPQPIVTTAVDATSRKDPGLRDKCNCEPLGASTITDDPDGNALRDRERPPEEPTRKERAHRKHPRGDRNPERDGGSLRCRGGGDSEKVKEQHSSGGRKECSRRRDERPSGHHHRRGRRRHHHSGNSRSGSRSRSHSHSPRRRRSAWNR